LACPKTCKVEAVCAAGTGFLTNTASAAAEPTKSCTDHDSAVALIAGPLGIDSCAKVEPVCGQAFDLTPFASMIPDPDTASGTAALNQLEEQLRSDLTALLTAAKASGEALQLAPVLELACPKTCKVEAVCAAGTGFLTNTASAAAEPTKSCTDHDSAVALIAGPLGIDSCAKVEPVCGQAFDLTPFASMIPDPDTASGTAALNQLEEQLRSDLTALLTAAKASGEALQLAPVLELACPKTCKVEAVCAAGTRFLRGRY